ncbi:hypothetical protein HAX54_024589 [Datura stramonium]|uniref:Uncharacterized protein n=1 Tax=Datura stramonium TaxID=4076 RepID=A0ABS8UYL1_DATST|nr:hypothetical protein [Datura stramonium]
MRCVKPTLEFLISTHDEILWEKVLILMLLSFLFAAVLGTNSALATLFFEKIRFHPWKCSKGHGHEMPMSATKYLPSQAKGQCPVPDEEALRNNDISLDDKSLPFVLHRLSSVVSADPQFLEKKASQVREVRIVAQIIVIVLPSVSQNYAGGSFSALWSAGRYFGYVQMVGENQQHSFIQQQPLSQQLHPYSSCSSSKLGFPLELDQFSMNHVHALAILISTFHHGKQPSAIDQKTFEEYTENSF